MTLTTIIILVSSIGICITVCFAISLVRGLKKLETRAKHFQWLVNSGLRESAYIIDPTFASWRNFG